MAGRPQQAPYSVSAKEILAQTPELRATRFVMAPGESTPWHRHGQVSDHFFCLAGPLTVLLRDPDEEITLDCGDETSIPPGRVHRVICPGPDPARYLLLQGLGNYDFIKVD